MVIKSKYLFAFLVLFYAISILLGNHFLEIDKLTYNQLAENFAQNQINSILETQKKWAWVGYAIVPLAILIRTSLVTFCLSIGIFFYDVEKIIKFKQLFRVGSVR